MQAAPAIQNLPALYTVILLHSMIVKLCQGYDAPRQQLAEQVTCT